MGFAMQLALAYAPDPGLGPAKSGLPQLDPSLSATIDIVLRNLLTLALIAAGGIAAGLTVLSQTTAHPRRRMLTYAMVLAVVYWAYFVSGVDWLAGDLALSRPTLAAKLVHGYLEWPALLLPWAAVAFAVTAHRKLDLRLVGVACACSVGLLVGSAVLEATVVPDLLRTTA